MLRGYVKLLAVAVLPVVLLGVGMSAGTALAAPSRRSMDVNDRVRHELLMLPFYGVFDDLTFRVEDGNTVVLAGQVTNPVLKSGAEAAAHRLRE